MRNYVKLIAVPAIVLAAACGREQKPQMDDALRNDLSLASTAQPYQPQQFVSPEEQGYTGAAAQNAPGYAAPAPRYSAPAPRRTSSAVRRTTGTRRASSGGGVYTAPAPRERVVVKKNTKRDAIIGAAAGAAIGAAASRDRVKGAVIGAAAGGILGGIIGNNVDVQRRRVPY